jgi:tetratricopeptide (TPR) repeat protein
MNVSKKRSTAEALNRGWHFHQAGDFSRAEETYRECLEQDADSPDAWRLLGAARQSLGRTGEAVECFQRALALRPDDPEPRNLLAVSLVALGRFEEAVAEFRRTIALRPGDAELRFNLGLALRRQGRTAEAIAAWNTAIELNPNHPGARRGLEEAARIVPGPKERRRNEVPRAHAKSPNSETHAEAAALLAHAWRAHTSGDLKGAEAAYRRALEIDGARADVWYLLGAVCQASKRLDEAVSCFRRAISLDAEYADAHNYLAVALMTMGQLDEGAAAFRRAIELKPREADLHLNLGAALRMQQRHSEATAAYREALRLRPEHTKTQAMLRRSLRSLGHSGELVDEYRRVVEARPDSVQSLHALGLALMEAKQHDEALAVFRRALELDVDSVRIRNNIGLALTAQDRLEEATAVYREALRVRPEFAEGHNNLGVALAKLKRADDAMEHYREALRLRPDFAQAHSNLGGLLGNRGDFDAAERHQRRAIELRPKFAEAHCNLGAVLMQCGRYDDAEAALRCALQLKPDFVEAHGNLGGVLAGRGDLAAAEASYARALSFDPEFPGARYNRSLVWLAQGQYNQGWRDYEFRFRCDELKTRAERGERWDGGPLGGRTLLVHAEQGLGDTIQFARYLPRVAGQGGRVLFECQKPLVGLIGRLRGLPDSVQIVAAGEKLPPYQVQVPLMSLPLTFGTSLETIPADIPYLSADTARLAAWRRELAGLSAVKVGIAWQGNPKHRGDRYRSIPLAMFEPLARLKGVKLFSLQKNHGHEQLATVPFANAITDLSQHDKTILDTASIIDHLDLMICCDTALAHLAGALAKPAWVALASTPDWRWLLERDDSPWYPSMRLFRQRRAGDWADVFERIAVALGEVAASSDFSRRES